MKYVCFSLLICSFIFFGCKTASETNSAPGQVALPPATAFDTTVMGKRVQLYYLSNGQLRAAVTNYGARMVSLLVPGNGDTLRDVVVGFGDINSFITGEERYFGAIVGRYGNRIAKGSFTLDGKSYTLDINNAPNSLHGGRTGFHSRVWDAVQPDSSTVVLTYVSPDMEEGYPGTLTTKVTYHLTDKNELEMSYEMQTDKATVINITNHNYWNLNGEGSGTINDHQLLIKASKITAVDSTLIPKTIIPVVNTPFDFTTFHTIGERINATNEQLGYGKGYDHNYVLDKGLTATAEHIATVKGDKSGIVMDIFTTEPAVQFYGGNFMQAKHTLKSGAKDDHRTAFCLETQHYPDSPNQPEFPTTVLRPGQVYRSMTTHTFSIGK